LEETNYRVEVILGELSSKPPYISLQTTKNEINQFSERVRAVHLDSTGSWRE
jgi:hypothetical protein